MFVLIGPGQSTVTPTRPVVARRSASTASSFARTVGIPSVRAPKPQTIDPKKVGERVVDAIRTKTFYAFVSAVPADVIKARHRRIEEAMNSPWVTHY